MTNRNKNTRLLSLKQLINGIDKHLEKGGLVIDGQRFSRADLVKELQALVATTEKVVTARAQWQMAVADEHAEIRETSTFVTGLRQTLLIMFASSNDVLADFGLARRARRELTPVEKVQRSAKAQATRAARHTMGKREKEKIKSTEDVTVVIGSGDGGNGGASHAPSSPAPAPAPGAAPVPSPAPAPMNGASYGANGASSPAPAPAPGGS
jgi:hypothetical protein